MLGCRNWNQEAQTGIKIAGRNISHLRYADDTTLMAESEEELKSPLMKVKEESEKVGLKLSIQKTKIMTSGPINSWGRKESDTTEGLHSLIHSLTVSTVSPSISHEVMGPDAMIFIF